MVVAKKRRQKSTVSTAALSTAAAHPAPAVTPRVVPSAAAAKKAAASQAKKAAGGAMAGSMCISVGGLEGLHPSCACGMGTVAMLGGGHHGVSLEGPLGCSNPANAPPLPPPPPPRKAASSSSGSRPASAACQSTLIAHTLQLYGGIVQVITEAAAPYRVLAVSPAWQRLSGYEKHEVVGKPLKMMQGVRTEPEAVAALMRGVQLREPVSVRLTNYTKAGETFVHQLACEPLRDETGQAQCFQATSVVLRKPGQPDEVEKALNAIGAARIAGMVSLASSSNRCPLLWPLVGAKAAAGAGLACGGVRASLASAPPDELNLPPISAESFFAEELGAFGLQAQLGPGDVANPAAIYSACLRPPPPAASDSMDSDGIDGMGISVSLDTVVAAPLEDFELLDYSLGGGVGGELGAVR